MSQGSSTDFSNEVVRLSKAAEAVVLDLMPGDALRGLHQASEMTLRSEQLSEHICKSSANN
eukprot:4168896-Amphidinium_carterae.1